MSDSDEGLAELLSVVMSGRPEAFVDVGLTEAPAGAKAVLQNVRETFAAVGLAEAPTAPPAGLRERILRSVKARSKVARKAVLVVDMLNDHLVPGRPLEVPRARGIVPALVARLEQARRENVPVVYVLDEHEPGDSDLDLWGSHNVKGTEGAAIWPALTPKSGDRLVRKPTYSAFTRSNLADVLSELRVDTLVLTGCLTEVGLLATATDAMQRGFAVEIPPDSQAGATAQSEHVALGIVGLLGPYGPARQALLEAASAATL